MRISKLKATAKVVSYFIISFKMSACTAAVYNLSTKRKRFKDDGFFKRLDQVQQFCLIFNYWACTFTNFPRELC